MGVGCHHGNIQRQVYHNTADPRLEQPEHRWDSVTRIINEINDSIFQKTRAQDDKDLEEEAKSLLNGMAVVLETECFNGSILHSSIAPAVLIHGDEGKGFIHSRLAEGSIDILATGLKIGTGRRILVLSDGRTGLVFRSVIMRSFLFRDF
ncbi:unnamed protein product [Penicillium nalgiovense]|nr:unnamed protein product [Penicillium nalgiovense]